jgi:two-component system response regulator HydG
VRELENAMQRAVALAEDEVIHPEDLPEVMRQSPALQIEGPSGLLEVPLGLTLEEVEDLYIRRTVDQVGGNLSEASRRLGVSRSTLWRKLKRGGS